MSILPFSEPPNAVRLVEAEGRLKPPRGKRRLDRAAREAAAEAEGHKQ